MQDMEEGAAATTTQDRCRPSAPACEAGRPQTAQVKSAARRLARAPDDLPTRQIGSGRQTRQYRTFRPLISVTALRQIQQRFTHRIERIRLSAKIRRARFCQRPDLRTGAITIGPQIKQLSDFLDRKAEIAGIGYEAKAMDVRVAIIAIATVSPRRRRDQADLLIVADHPLRDPARGRRTADVHSVTRLRRSALVTTLTDDSAIAAAAMIGESRMPKIG